MGTKIKFLLLSVLMSNILHSQSTNNVMCYRDIAYSTWRWQWHIINPNISEK